MASSSSSWPFRLRPEYRKGATVISPDRTYTQSQLTSKLKQLRYVSTMNSQTSIHNSSSLDLVHWNCNSIRNGKIEQLKLLIDQHKPVFILKTNKAEANLLLDIAVPTCRVKRRSSGNGGGATLLVKYRGNHPNK